MAMIVCKIFLFLFLLTTPVVRNSTGIYFNFLKNVLKQTWKFFNTEFVPYWQDRKNSYQVRRCNLQLNCHNFWLKLWKILVLSEFYKTNFEVVWAELKVKISFQRQSFTKCSRQVLVFIWYSTLQEIFIVFFSIIFCYYWKRFRFDRKTGC